MKAFICSGDLYLRVIPSKYLFRSTMVHDVVNRGNIFALRLKDQMLTIIPGGTVVEHIDIEVKVPALPLSTLTQEPQAPLITQTQKLQQIKLDLQNNPNNASAKARKANES